MATVNLEFEKVKIELADDTITVFPNKNGKFLIRRYISPSSGEYTVTKYLNTYPEAGQLIYNNPSKLTFTEGDAPKIKSCRETYEDIPVTEQYTIQYNQTISKETLESLLMQFVVYRIISQANRAYFLAEYEKQNNKVEADCSNYERDRFFQRESLDQLPAEIPFIYPYDMYLT